MIITQERWNPADGAGLTLLLQAAREAAAESATLVLLPVAYGGCELG